MTGKKIHKPVKWIGVDKGPDWGIIFGIPPKSGSSSIRKAILDEGYEYRRVDPKSCENRIFVVRDPIDRFKSLWKNKCRDGGKIRASKNGDNHPVQGMSPEELFDYITQHSNHHWTPQWILLGDVEAELVRIEDMADWWDAQNFSTVPYPRTNVTKGDIDLNPALEAKIRDYYRGDYDLLERVSKTAAS